MNLRLWLARCLCAIGVGIGASTSCAPATSLTQPAPPTTAVPLPDASVPAEEEHENVRCPGVVPLTPDAATPPHSVVIRDPGPPAADVRVLGAEVRFRHWPTGFCGFPECSEVTPIELQKLNYRKRQRVESRSAIDSLWKQYKAVRTSAIVPFVEECDDRVRMIVVFCTSEPAVRWLAVGDSCRILMLTDDYQLHEKYGPLFRELANIVGVRKELEKTKPDIWQ